MKRLLTLFLLLPLLFACSSDDGYNPNLFNTMVFYAKYDDEVKASYQVQVYEGDVSDYRIFNPGHGKLPAFATRLDEQLAFPLHSSDKNIKGDPDYNGYAVDVFYAERREEHYVGRYTIHFIVNVYGKGYFQCVKSFDIDKDTAIRLKFHKLSDFDKKDIDGDWQVVDATKENYRDLIDFD